MKTAILNYITLNAWHPHGQKRLGESLKRQGFTGDYLIYNPHSLPCITHSEVPYAFKFFAILDAIKKGYDRVLWLDASFWAVLNPDFLFDRIGEVGVLVQNSSYFMGQWSSDASLKHLGISREDAWKIKMYSGGFMGFDLKNSKVLDFLAAVDVQILQKIGFQGAWTNKKQEVSTDSAVRGHRHDMVVGSILLERSGFPIQADNTLFSYYGWYEKYKNELDLKNVAFVCEGGMRKI